MWNMAHIGIGALWKASKLGLKLMNQPTGSETVVLGAAERGAHSQSDEYACWLSISIR
jgi:non-canonical (house-cleaning) NTP pyrophosphatase